jgi:GR25 family glycosyltransferase involved in LPS biosynthesis
MRCREWQAVRNYSEPVYVINLDRDTERLQSFLAVNERIDDFIHFPAIDGRLRDRETLRQEGIISQGLPYYNGQLGCALSHIALWHRGNR